jgi:hypothetical protein
MRPVAVRSFEVRMRKIAFSTAPNVNHASLPPYCRSNLARPLTLTVAKVERCQTLIGLAMKIASAVKKKRGSCFLRAATTTFSQRCGAAWNGHQQIVGHVSCVAS